MRHEAFIQYCQLRNVDQVLLYLSNEPESNVFKNEETCDILKKYSDLF